MSIVQLTCPSCATSLRLRTDANPTGRYKCPKCGTVFAVNPAAKGPASPARPPAPPLIRPAPAPQPPSLPPVTAIGTKAPPPRHRPAAPHSSGRGVSPGLLWGLVGGGVAVLALVVGLIIWGLNRGNSGGSSTPSDDSDRRATADRSDRNKDTLRDAARDVSKDGVRDAARDVQKDGTRDTTRDAPRDQPADRGPDSGRDRSTDPGDGSLPRDVLEKVKTATLYIRVQTAEGESGSGSGFFEESSGMVLTNAHVVGMLRAGSPAPRKLEVVVNSGRPGEATLPAQVFAVDRSSDLALLRVNLPAIQMNSLPRLKVATGKDLLETQRVYVVGFPFGEKVNRNATFSVTTISSLHRNAENLLTRIQVDGGMHPGNSGGPVIDARGNVIGVAVSGIPGTRINFAIPGDFVHAILEGRVAGLSVANDARSRNGKLVVPMRVETIDPRRRITRIEVDYWTGDPRPKPLSASSQRPELSPDCSSRRTTLMTYDPERSLAQVDLELEALPAPGKVLWVQPVVTNGTGKPLWVSSMAVPVAAPVEEKPANLTARNQVGKVAVDLKSTARFRLEGSGKELKYLQNIETRMTETTVSANANGSRLRLSVDRFAIGVSMNDKAPPTPERFQTAVKRDVGQLAFDVLADAKGNLTRKANDLSRVPLPSRAILDSLGDQITGSLDSVAIPQPGGMVQPGQSWEARRDLPLDMPGNFQTANLKMTYTYRGLRQHGGRPVAVIELRGVLLSPRGRVNLSGQTTGTALIDPATGMVLKANAVTDATLVIRIEGETFEARGKLDVRLLRGPEVDGQPVTRREEPKGRLDVTELKVLRSDQIVRALALDRDGKTLATASGHGGRPGQAQLWDLEAGRVLATLPAPAVEFLGVAISPDGQTVAAGCGDALVRLWDRQTRKEQPALKGHSSYVRSVVFSPDGKLLASASDNELKVWDVSTGREKYSLKGFRGPSAWRVSTFMAFSSDSKLLAAPTGDNLIKIWEMDKGEEQATLTGHTGVVWAVAFSPDNQRLASGSLDRTARLWDLKENRELARLPGHQDWVCCVAFSADGKLLATAGGDKDSAVKVWDATTRKELGVIPHPRGIACLAFSADGKRLATVSGQELRWWDLSRLKPG